MNCPNCNTPCAEDQKICFSCGTPLSADAQPTYHQQPVGNGFVCSDNKRQDYGSIDFSGNQQSSYIPTPVQMNNPDSILAMCLGIASLVFTLFSCICGCLGSVPALICGIVGLVIAIKCRKAAAAAGLSDGKATAGMVTSIIGLCLCALSCVGSLFTVGLTLFEDIFA